MPTQEEVEQFFLEFSREMKEQGLFILDNYIHFWEGLPFIDEVREAEKDEQTDDSDYEDVTQIR